MIMLLSVIRRALSLQISATGLSVCLRSSTLSTAGQSRSLTQNEASTALRPFYFAVHPDLFAQYPKERLVNEESLKVVNRHVELLLNKPDTVEVSKPRVAFYLRDPIKTKYNLPNLRRIEILLETSNIRKAVFEILKSCNLSTDYLESVKSSPRPPAPEYHQWRPIPNPEVVVPKPERYLSTWIRANVDRARLLHEACQPLHLEAERLKQLLCDKVGLKDVIWASNWGLSNFLFCMNRFLSLTDELMAEDWVDRLRGHSLIFGTETGVNTSGEIILSFDDAPQDWVNMLRSIYRHDGLLAELPELEEQVSAMLNGVALVREWSGKMLMSDYYSRNLQRFVHTLQDDINGRLTGRLGHLQLHVSGPSAPLTISPRGCIIIPSSCPGKIVRNFIQQKKVSAAHFVKSYNENRREESMLMSECEHALRLESLSKDEIISTVQCSQCCLRLLADVRQGVSLHGLRLRISQYYTVMSSGELIIPWDWKGSES